MTNDLRFALRMIATHRWFSLAVIVILALGIGINTTVFTLVNAVLFKPIPVPGGERLVTVSGQNLNKTNSRFGLSYPDYQEFRANNRSFEGLEATTGGRAVISEQGNPPDRYRMVRTTPGLFGMLRTPTVLGRGFTPEDGKPGAETVVLISHAVWQNRYGGANDVLNRAIRVNGSPATIVGVMPPGFKFPNSEDVWIPLVPDAGMENRTSRELRLFGLLKPGISIEEAAADLATIAQRITLAFPDTNKDVGAVVRTFHDTFNGGVKPVFLMMFGAVAFVLLISCANVANLMLSRAIGRRRELAVRASLGASRWQLIRQLLTESVLLSVLGGTLGLGLAAFGVHAFDLATAGVDKPYWIQFSMDYVVFAYFAVISVLSGLLFGLAPALRASRIDLNTALKDDAPSAGGASGGKLTAVLVVFQFALTVVLLAGAGLMVRSFFAAQSMNGFVPVSQIFTSRVALPEGARERYAAPAERLRFYEQLMPRLAALPGVTHATVTSNLPGTGGGNRPIEIEGQPLPDPSKAPRASTGVHSPGYPASIGLPIIAGRAFQGNDGDPGNEVAVVTQQFAAKFWPDRQAVGARFRFLEGKDLKSGPWINVVGVSADIVQRGEDPDAGPLVYTPYRMEPNVAMTIVLRTSGDPALLAPSVRAVVQGIDQDLPLFDPRTLAAALERRFWYLNIFGTLFLTFGVSALLMAAVGLYTVVAQATGRRTREIGIRMALGATAVRIMKLVLSRGLIQLGVGLFLGLAGALAATQAMAKSRLLFRVSAQDPFVFSAVTLLLLAIGILACWFPARRAAAIAPSQALRTE